MNIRPHIWSLRLCLMLVLLTGNGCLLIPIKEGGATSGRKVEAQATGAWHAGVTERRQVMRQLGEPYAEFGDLRVMVYEWVVVSSYMPWILPGQYSSAFGVLDVRQEHLLLVAYDEAGKVRGFDVVHHNFGRVRERCESWLKSERLAPAVIARPDGGGAVKPGMTSLVVYRSGTWSEIINPFPARVLVDGKLAAELDRDQYTRIHLPPGTHTVSCWMKAHPDDASSAMTLRARSGQTHYVGIHVDGGRGSTTLEIKAVADEAGAQAIRAMSREPSIPPVGSAGATR